MRYFRFQDGQLSADAHEAPAPQWFTDRVAVLHTRLTEARDLQRQDLPAELPRSPFPCYFAPIAKNKGSLRYTYLSGHERSHPDAFVEAVREYQRESPHIRPLGALLLFVETSPDVTTRGQYEAVFWSLLQYLHDQDVSPWPTTTSPDPDDPQWQFCFGGEPWFLVGKAPFYQRRKSRWADGLMLLVQTQKMLDPVDGYRPEADSIRQRIRAAITQYDGMPPSPDLEVVGDPAFRDWRQYWLRDTNEEPGPTRCPLRLHPLLETPGAVTAAGPSSG